MTPIYSILLVSALLNAQASALHTDGSATCSARAESRPLSELRSHPDWPSAHLGDAGSIRSITTAFFDVISAPKGGALNRVRLKSLFTPAGRIEIPTPASVGRQADVIFMSPDAYADMSDAATEKQGFFDHLLAMKTEQFGDMAHVYASYESRTHRDAPVPFVRGVKSFELFRSANRWYIAQVSWVRETEGNPIPEEYLHDSK